LDVSALNIRTAPDLVFVPPADPELLWELPTGTITFPDLTNHIAHVRNAVAGPALTGDRLSGGLEARVQLLSVPSGLPALDELVAVVGNRFGGASVGRIVEISGANGWSQIPALHIILHHIESHPADAALWLDTTGHLAPARLATFASRSPSHKELLTRLNIASTFDTSAARLTIEALGNVSSKLESLKYRFRVVVLDTVTALLGPQLSGVSSQGHADMTMFMRLLRDVAQKHGLCILVLNDATAASRPALGPSFTFMTDATLWLARSPGQDHEVRTAEILRSRISATGPRCAFRIRDGRVMAA